jgi:cytosine permease
MKNLQNWWTLSAIQIGCVICLPTIMIGQHLSQRYGFLSAVFAILLGNAILLMLGLVTVRMCHGNRKTTMENAGEYFGGRGAQFFAFAMIISLVCWFGIQLNMMSLGVLDLLSIQENRGLWQLFLNAGLGIIMTFAILAGIRSLGILANLSIPFLLLTLGYAVYTLEPKNMGMVSDTVSFSFQGASLVISLAIAFVVDLPTYYRFAKTSKDGLISITLIIALVMPVLQIVGVYLTAGADGANILEVLKRENQNLWNIWVAIFLILAGWTTNNVNLYSSAMCLQTIFRKLSEKRALLYVGMAGTFLSCFDLLKHLEMVLGVIGIFIGSMGAVVLTRYLFLEYYGKQLSSRDHFNSLVTWACGIIVGFFSLIMGYSLTTIPLLDAVLGASVSTVFFTLTPIVTYEKA